MADPAFKFTRAVPVRFRDIDAMGHAHHSMILVYIEEARAAFWREVAGREGLEGIDYVMAQVTLSFKQRIEFPGTLQVALRISKIGGSSFTMQYEVRSPDGTVAATAETVQVMYDYAASASKPIDADLRATLEQYA